MYHCKHTLSGKNLGAELPKVTIKEMNHCANFHAGSYVLQQTDAWVLELLKCNDSVTVF